MAGGLARRVCAEVRSTYSPLAEARPVLAAFAGELPNALRGASLAEPVWLAWEKERDQEIRARLETGDADSVFNLVLFGTSFTAQPRVSGRDQPGDEAVAKLILARVRDLAEAAKHPAANERVQFVAEWLKRHGADPAAPDSAKRGEALLLENALRVRREQRAYAQTIADAKRTGDAASLFVTRSSLYRDRGLSLDTSFRPNFAIEHALAAIQTAALLGKVARAAVIGPGLDFVDKRSGYDFYPVQTLQPFALIDALRKLRLADSSGPALTVFDLSERVLGHVRRAVTHARNGSPYTLQIPLDGDTRWLPETVAYWQQFGSQVGAETKAGNPPAGVSVRMRAVRIRPDVVSLLAPLDLDVVTSRLPLPGPQRFDLIVATNILVYYSPFEQGLALQNIARMLQPGGVLLSNNALPDVTGVPIEAAGSTSVAYSADPDDGDRILWYRRERS